MTERERWRAYPLSIIGHHVQGAVAGALMGVGDAYLAGGGLTLLGLSMAYQWAGWAKYRDSVKRDIRDYIVGWCIGAPLGCAIRFLLR